jgi:hypothetical protein
MLARGTGTRNRVRIFYSVKRNLNVNRCHRRDGVYKPLTPTHGGEFPKMVQQKYRDGLHTVGTRFIASAIY